MISSTFQPTLTKFTCCKTDYPHEAVNRFHDRYKEQIVDIELQSIQQTFNKNLCKIDEVPIKSKTEFVILDFSSMEQAPLYGHHIEQYMHWYNLTDVRVEECMMALIEYPEIFTQSGIDTKIFVYAKHEYAYRNALSDPEHGYKIGPTYFEMDLTVRKNIIHGINLFARGKWRYKAGLPQDVGFLFKTK